MSKRRNMGVAFSSFFLRGGAEFTNRSGRMAEKELELG
jgi:hypothetical protein